MNDPSPSDDRSQQLEEIVAYLDGELSPQESAEVEQRLAADDSFRQQLQSMERAWTALDQLPVTTVDDTFAKTTMEMVVQAAQSEVDQKTQALPALRRRRRLSTILLATTAALLGGLVTQLIWENPNRKLIADLPVIEYIDIYTQFNDVGFLRLLQRELGSDNWASQSDSEQPGGGLESLRSLNSFENRKTWLESLEDEERAALRAKFNRFEAMSTDQQDRLRELHREIQTSEDAVKLQQTMLAYQQWLHGVPPSEQYELRELEPEKRVLRIARMVERQSQENRLDLSDEELRKFFRAVRPHLEAMGIRRLAYMSRRERAEFLSKIPPESILELFRAIREALPEAKLEQFDKLPLQAKKFRFFVWMRQAAQVEEAGRRPGQRRRREQISEQELEEFFVDELDASDQERLLAMPRDRMQQELLRLYHVYQGKLPARDWDLLDEEQHRERRPHGPPRSEDRRRGLRPQPEFRADRGPPPPREGPPPVNRPRRQD